MGAIISYLREFHFWIVVFRLALAVVSGFAIGYGRARKSAMQDFGHTF